MSSSYQQVCADFLQKILYKIYTTHVYSYISQPQSCMQLFLLLPGNTISKFTQTSLKLININSLNVGQGNIFYRNKNTGTVENNYLLLLYLLSEGNRLLIVFLQPCTVQSNHHKREHKVFRFTIKHQMHPQLFTKLQIPFLKSLQDRAKFSN